MIPIKIPSIDDPKYYSIKIQLYRKNKLAPQGMWGLPGPKTLRLYKNMKMLWGLYGRRISEIG